MRLTTAISLFSEPEPIRLGSWPYLVSTLVHGSVFGLLFYGVIHVPEVSDRVVDRYTIRQVELRAPKPRLAAWSKSREMGSPTSDHKASHEDANATEARSSPEMARLAAGRQILIRPDLPANLTPAKEIPIPTVVIWTPQRSSVKKIVPPAPKAATEVDAKPSPDAPNEELNFDKLSVSIAGAPVENSLLVFASTTSPIVVHGPPLDQPAPATTAGSISQPTPAAVMAISDQRMEEGTVTLAPANETLPEAAHTFDLGLLASTPQEGSVIPKRSNMESAPRQEATQERDLAHSGVHGGTDAGKDLLTDRITMPRDGQYPLIVLGSYLEEEYPELLQIWSGRQVYSVYLQVGLAKNWTLQYSLSRSSEFETSGEKARLEAPWPYDIVRPRLEPKDVPANAIVVHGNVSDTGRFNSLTVVYPDQFQYASFLLNILQRWKFRPATQNGAVTEVEIVLVIPEDAGSSE